MSLLTSRERDLVALGAALGSNCNPCIEHDIPASRNIGPTDSQIAEVVRLADKVRQGSSPPNARDGACAAVRT